MCSAVHYSALNVGMCKERIHVFDEGWLYRISNVSCALSVYGALTYHCKLKTEQRIKLYGCPFS